jgi:predicted outer membrane repeat protein
LPLISNIIICNNQATNGGAIYARSSFLALSNLTIANNRAIEKGGAIFLYRTERFNIKNSIIWDNKAQVGTSIAFMGISDTDTVVFNYTDFDTTESYWQYMSASCDMSRLMWWGYGNISADPRFNDSQINDYTLRADSPCIDGGDPADDVGQEPVPHGNRINMGAYGGTRMAAISTALPSIDPSQPFEFKLAQNYPNPFNTTTVISWQLAVGNDVDLSVYNLIGQKVATLVSERQSAGIHKVEWDASGLANGVYIYRLSARSKARSFVQTKKLVLLK